MVINGVRINRVRVIDREAHKKSTTLTPLIVSYPSENIASILVPNTRAILKARGNEGSYLPFSIAIMVWRDTSSLSASSLCDQPAVLRLSLILLFMSSAFLPHSTRQYRRPPIVSETPRSSRYAESPARLPPSRRWRNPDPPQES